MLRLTNWVLVKDWICSFPKDRNWLLVRPAKSSVLMPGIWVELNAHIWLVPKPSNKLALIPANCVLLRLRN